MGYTHKRLASGAWSSLSLAEQLGNIGSEVERAIAWHKKQDSARFEQAFARLLELIDLTLSDERWKGPKRREVARLREEICSLFEESTPDLRILEAVKRDFLYYGILARARRL